MHRFIFILYLICKGAVGISQPRTDNLLQQIFTRNQDGLFKSVINNPDIYRCQVIYTQINRDRNNTPAFTNYYYNYDSLRYFNPASTVKMPLAFLSLEKLHQLKQHGVDMFTPMQFDSGYSRQTVQRQYRRKGFAFHRPVHSQSFFGE